MKPGFDLLRKKGTAGVYFRTWNGLEGIPSAEEAVIHFGADWGNYVQEVDTLEGDIVDGWKTKVATLTNDLLVNTKTVADLTSKVNLLSEQVKTLQNQPPKVEIKEVKVEVPVEKIVEKEVIKYKDKIVTKEVLVQPQTVGECLIALWNIIKGIKA
jgi:hypothetical protein